MANLTTTKQLMTSKGFTGSLNFLTAAFDTTDFGSNVTLMTPPNLNAATNDLIVGNGRDETLAGGNGNDILIGGGGRDALVGGEGTDWASYATATSSVRVSLLTPSSNKGDALGDTFSSIENLMGSGFNDHLTGDNRDNVIAGLDGDDQIYGLSGNDTLNGEGGRDYLVGGTGLDTMNGGSGDDTLYGNGGDTLNGDAHNDSLYSTGQVGDTMNGGSGDDVFHGTLQLNTLGLWRMNGGEGNDTFFGRNAREAFDGGGQSAGGVDHVSYKDTFASVTVNLQLGVGIGGAAQGDTYTGIEAVTGSRVNDTLIGSTRSERLEGGAGNDTLTSGGTGDADVFYFKIVQTHPLLEGAETHRIGHDVITDFDIKVGANDTTFDVIYLDGLSQAQIDALSVTQVGADTVVTASFLTGSITIQNFDADLWTQFF